MCDISKLLSDSQRSLAPLLFTKRASELLESHDFHDDPRKSFTVHKGTSLIAKNLVDDKPPVVFVLTIDRPSATVTSIKPFSVSAQAPSTGFQESDIGVVGTITFKDGETKNTVLIETPELIGACKPPNDQANPLAHPIVFAESMEKQLSTRGTGKIVAHDLVVVDCQPPALMGIDESLMCGYRLANFAAAYVALSVFCEMKKSSIFVLCGASDDATRTWMLRELDGVACELVVNVVGRRTERKEIEDTGLEIGDGVGVIVNGPGIGGSVRPVSRVEEAAKRGKIPFRICGGKETDRSMAIALARRLRVDDLELAFPVLGRGSARETIAVDDVRAMERILRELFC